MIGIDGASHTQAITPQQQNGENSAQISLLSPMNIALVELEATAGTAMFETLEEMSMVLGSRFQSDKSLKKAEENERKQQALIAMMQRLKTENGAVRQITQRQANDSPEQEKARRMMAVALQLTDRKLSEKQRDKLKNMLDSLLEEQGWEIDLFGLLELGELNRTSLDPIKRLFQQAMDEEAISLNEWFRRVAEWPDRRQRVKVLLRAMAFELSFCLSAAQQQRLAAVLTRLRRLLLFLGLEKECQRGEENCQLPADSLLPVLIDISAESWLFIDWLQERLAPLTSSPARRDRLLHYLQALFALMPDPCFIDEDQREQIITVLRELKCAQV